MKKVNPTNQYLFGNALGQVCKNLKESGQVCHAALINVYLTFDTLVKPTE